MPPTPQYQWPLLTERLAVEVWLKHENHTPVGAFKVRGGLVYFADNAPDTGGVVCATRGNHGQSIAFAARRYDIPVTIVVPRGNSIEKNAAMVALGAKLIEHGDDFQDSLEFAQARSRELGSTMVPSFNPQLVRGVATYSLELFRAIPDLDALYVPIGLGSGICGAVAAKNALGLNTEIVGVVSSHAPAYLRSFECGEAVECPTKTEIADGVACRKPNADALETILSDVSRIEEVTDDQVREAMRDIYECTHNVAEGAGALSIAAIKQDAEKLKDKQVGAVLCGGNIDRSVFARIIA